MLLIARSRDFIYLYTLVLKIGVAARSSKLQSYQSHMYSDVGR